MSPGNRPSQLLPNPVQISRPTAAIIKPRTTNILPRSFIGSTDKISPPVGFSSLSIRGLGPIRRVAEDSVVGWLERQLCLTRIFRNQIEVGTPRCGVPDR